MTLARSSMIEQHIDSFPVLPVTVSRVMEVTNDPDSSAQDLMEVIQPDQSLSLTVLKIANSVLFGRPKKVDSLKLAVTILGFNEVQSIAISKALINSFNELPREQRPYIDNFWSHSFLCAMAARKIATDLDYKQDIAFMGGLIHDVGKLVLLQTFSDEYDPSVWMTQHTTEKGLEQEKRIFSFAHDEIGEQLLNKWNFPDTLMAAVSHHHHPHRAKAEQVYAYFVQLADLLAFCCVREEEPEEDVMQQIGVYLPGIYDKWNDAGLPVQRDTLASWYDWLVEHRKHGQQLQEIFAS